MFLSSLPKYTHIALCHFRFQKQDMDRLLEALQIPDSYTSHQGSVFTGMESLMILLRRLSYPNRWCDLVPIFGRTEPELSMAFDMVIMKHLNVHKLRRCINHAYRIYISGMHSHHVIIDFRSLMICIQDSVLVWLLWIWYGLIQVYFQMQYTERVHPLNRFGDSSMVLHAQLQGPFATKESCIVATRGYTVWNSKYVTAKTILISNSTNTFGERKHTPHTHSSSHCNFFLG